MYLILSDIHLKDNNIEVIKNLFDEIHDVGIKNILILGDFFDTRKGLSTKVIVESIKLIEIMKDFQVYILVGNHDSLYKKSVEPTALDLFKKFDNVEIVKEIKEIDKNIVMVPWIWDNDILQNIDDQENKYILGHFDIVGFKMNDSYVSKKGIDSSTLSNFKKVYTGHFHTPSKSGNIEYIGSVIPHTFHDENSPRGYYIFDPDNDIMEFTEFTSAPKFITIDTEKPIESYDIEGNYIKIDYKRDYGTKINNEIMMKVESMNPLKIKTNTDKLIDENEMDENDESLIDSMTNKEIFKHYITDVINLDNFEHINKGILVKLIETFSEGDDL